MVQGATAGASDLEVGLVYGSILHFIFSLASKKSEHEKA